MFLCDTLVYFVWNHAGHVRKALMKNLNIIFGNSLSYREKVVIGKKALTFQIYNIVEFLLMAMGLIGLFRITHEGFEKYRAQVRKGKNISFISGHFGNWELLGSWLSGSGIPLCSIILPPRHSVTDSLYTYIREKYGIKTVVRTETRQIYKYFRDKRYNLGFLSDQDGEASGFWLDFFGRKVSFPSGVAFFAEKKGVVFLPVIIKRLGFLRHKVCFYDPIIAEGKTRDEKKRDFSEKIIHFYEDIIREYPENWLLVYDRWKYRRHYPICRRNVL